MLLRLEHNNDILGECDVLDIPEEGMKIGRDAKCAWRIGDGARGVSGVHATLTRVGRHASFEDHSTYGTLWRSKRIHNASLRLKVGMRLKLGDAVLTVEKSPKPERRPPCSRLTVERGTKKRISVDISERPLTIGKDPKADLVLPDDHVSDTHAIITARADGSCQLVDDGSTNGTRLNDSAGEKLLPQKAYSLKHRDTIFIRQFAILFEHGPSRVAGARVRRAATVLAVTALVCLLGWLFYRVVIYPPSRYWLDVAAKEAALEHFSIAEAELARTRYSWDRKLYEHEIDELARKIPRWESTCGQWRGVVTDMREGDHDNANNGLVPLVARPLGDWQWKRKARAYGTQAGRLKKLLESYQRGKKAMAKADATLDQLQRCTEGITSVVDELSQQAARPSVLPEGAGSPSAGLTSYPPTSGEQEPENGPLNVSIDEWGELSEPLNGLIKKACELVQELQAPGAAWQDLQDSLACCRDWPPPADEELEGLMRAAREISGKVEWPFLKAPAEELITKLNSARERLTALKEARAYVCDGCFREGVELLTADHWDGQKLDPNASPLKALLISISNSGNSLRTQAAAIEPRYKRVQNLVSQNGQYFRDGKHLRDASVLSGIYAVDSLDSPYPARNQLAVGNYDKYLSRAEFYAFLSSPDSSLGETSILAKCVLTVRAVEELVGESRRADYRWMFAEGNLKKEIDSLAGSVLEPRKRIIHATLAHANDDSRGPRERIIAAGIASALASEGDELTIGEENQRKKVGDWISGQLNELKRKLQELDGPYELAAPERKIEIRTEVLATGIPGQNVVQKMWRRRPHTGQGQ